MVKPFFSLTQIKQYCYAESHFVNCTIEHIRVLFYIQANEKDLKLGHFLMKLFKTIQPCKQHRLI